VCVCVCINSSLKTQQEKRNRETGKKEGNKIWKEREKKAE